ncbi:hypothetical protein JTB14_001182 [Gonioctena quinquepunctata]|nr:hypothetical protein JTB14_001182 [Gonioctena quinquepunctata]
MEILQIGNEERHSKIQSGPSLAGKHESSELEKSQAISKCEEKINPTENGQTHIANTEKIMKDIINSENDMTSELEQQNITLDQINVDEERWQTQGKKRN